MKNYYTYKDKFDRNNDRFGHSCGGFVRREPDEWQNRLLEKYFRGKIKSNFQTKPHIYRKKKLMDNMGSLQWDMMDLSNHLRQERLFVSAEQQHLQSLNEKVLRVSSRLAQLAWVTSQQRVNLNHLILARPEFSPAVCCQKSNLLESTAFIDGYKVLGFQECILYGDFLQTLRTSPQLLASCLVAGEQVLPEMMSGIVLSLVTGLYGSCLLPDDRVFTLKLLQHLMELQLSPSDNPRRLLRHDSCAFSRLYSAFHEGLFSAKLFLTAALHGPIMHLLMEDEMFLDIDPAKAGVRFHPDEKLKRFGKEGTPEYNLRIQNYRNWTIGKLVAITSRFIKSLKENMHCFPPSVSWLVKQMYDLLMKSKKVDAKEVNAMCTDLVFTFFICPAIVNPEPYGITDAPISYIARFNLIQVAQILQVLAVWKYEEIDTKLMDLYSRFDKDCVSSLLDAMLEGSINGLDDGPSTGDVSRLQGLSRSSALFTETELFNLVSFFQTVSSEVGDKSLDKKNLEMLISQLPLATAVNGHPGGGHRSAGQTGSVNNVSPPGTPNTNTKRNLLGKVGKSRGRPPLLSSSQDNLVDGIEDDNLNSGPLCEDVLIIPFSTNPSECVGMMSENKVLSMEHQHRQGKVRMNLDNLTNQEEGEPIMSGETQEKRTRFSLSHDEGSIGNTSDNLEAVSEAASNHSVASSLELENEDQNDNLSDMVSANVSGRGTPNISGRDTPSSQITEGEENVLRNVGEPRQPLDLPATTTRKQSRTDIDDKFGKFEIKKLIEGDETVSMVSDTWSTDVLASDSETVEQSERTFPHAEDHPPRAFSDASQHLLDVSETASEAWSTDVLASDSERLGEVDTDDTGSVARSDDTARSEVEVEARGEPEGGEETPPQCAPASSVMFRPIREEPQGRSDNVDGPAVTIAQHVEPSEFFPQRKIQYERSSLNLTGIGSAFRELEHNLKYLKIAPDGEESSGLIHGIPKPRDLKSIDGTVSFHDVNGVAVPEVNGCSQVAVKPIVTTDSEPKQAAEDEVDGEVGPPVARLSSASLASSSSSGSSDPRLKPNSISTATVVSDGSTIPENSIPDGIIGTSKPAGSSVSTGAIPKSISFDKTAERGDKELLDDDQKHKRSFFRNFKLPFKNRNRKSPRGTQDDMSRGFDPSMGGDGDGHLRLRRGLSDDGRPGQNDITEDILAKYRRKPGAGDSSISSENTVQQLKVKEEEDERLVIDPLNVEASFAFADAKRKLRLVLSTADLQHAPWTTNNFQRMREVWAQKENELVSFLQLQLAEAINLQDRSLIAHLHETLRCIRLFDDEGCRKLFKSLKEDYKKRSPYIAYLVRCRQGLLSTIAHLERIIERVKCDHQVCSKYLVAVCVRIFLEKREQLLVQFTSEFQHLTVSDEKTDLLDDFLQKLNAEMERDATWQVASGTQLEQAKAAVERAVMSRVYMHALYPNGDGDISRDQVLHEHMKKLSKVITPNHKDLRVPKMFHYECPWPSAQAEIAAISAYKTPKDKLKCVLRCSTTIMNLLSMACERGVPAADDFIPVLVYVLIKANPPSLLSTVQYVNSFYGNRLEGEEQYWWIQFCSTIEFIKTMDYSD